jgi:uncharacterized membrane protein
MQRIHLASLKERPMADVKTMLVMPGKKFSVSKAIKRAVQAACGAAASAGVIGFLMVTNGLLTGRGTTMQWVNVWLNFVKRGDILATMLLTAATTVIFVYWQRDKERNR